MSKKNSIRRSVELLLNCCSFLNPWPANGPTEVFEVKWIVGGRPHYLSLFDYGEVLIRSTVIGPPLKRMWVCVCVCVCLHECVCVCVSEWVCVWLSRGVCPLWEYRGVFLCDFHCQSVSLSLSVSRCVDESLPVSDCVWLCVWLLVFVCLYVYVCVWVWLCLFRCLSAFTDTVV